MSKKKATQELSSFVEVLTQNFMLLCTDKQGKITYANEKFCKAYDYDEQDIIGEDVSIFDSPYYAGAFYSDAISRVLKGKVWRGEAKQKDSSGEEFWVECCISLKQNQIFYILNEIQDEKVFQTASKEVAKAALIGEWRFDVSSEKIYWSEMTYKIHETSPQDYTPAVESSIECYLEEDRPIIEKAFKKALTKGTPYDLELRIKTFKGNIRWVRAIGHVIFKSKKIYMVYGSFQDIHEKKVTELELREFKDRLDIALEATQIGIWDWDLLSNSLYWDENMYRVYGVNKKIQDKVENWESMVYPEDLANLYNTVEKAIKNKTMLRSSFKMRRGDGKDRLIRTIGKASYREDGQALRMVGANWDVTDEMEANEALLKINNRLDIALEATKIGIWDWDISTGFLHWDQRMLEVYDLKKGEFSNNFSSWEACVLEEDLEETNKKVMKALETGETFNTQFRTKTKNGDIRYIKGLGRAFYDLDKKPIRMVGANWDITEEQEINQKILVEQEKAKNALKVRSEFLANMSHEIRTPLNSIIGMSELLLTEELSSKQREMMFLINYSGSTLLNLINDVLDFSKIEAKKLTITKSYFKLKNLIINSVKMFDAPATNKSISLNYNINENVPASIFSDEHRLNQVLLNLISNAVKFTDEGSVSLDVLFEPKSKNNGVLILEITDTGVGISKSMSEKLFQPFEQQDGSLSRKYGGTGLGLAISMELINLLEGKITVESQEGVGSKFRVHIPILAGTDIELKQAEEVDVSKLVGLSINILVVEDNSINQLLMKSLLKKLGFNASIAENGKHAIELCEEKSFDLIFMDMQMPVMDGLEATRLLRERKKDYPIIVAMTANVFDEDKQNCFDAGMNDFIAKPVKKNILLEAILRYIDVFESH